MITIRRSATPHLLALSAVLLALSAAGLVMFVRWCL